MENPGVKEFAPDWLGYRLFDARTGRDPLPNVSRPTTRILIAPDGRTAVFPTPDGMNWYDPDAGARVWSAGGCSWNRESGPAWTSAIRTETAG
jgi:hypothetical protein